MSFSFPENERAILAFWQQNNTFQASIEQRAEAPAYVFYDGPPFATGLPHHGHLLASTLKDIIPRYKTMQGFRVERRFGWDCHGVPIEHEIDKQHQKSTHEVVEEIGIAGYNQACRDIVMRYSSQWRTTIERLGRWVDFDNDYKTMDPTFMESVWWVFQTLWNKGLIYQGTKVVPFSTALGTVLSNFEASSNYQDVQDPSVMVLFKLQNEAVYLAVWTTTPWTLPANLGLCVGPDITYVKAKDLDSGKIIILAAERFAEIASRHNLEKIETLPASQLIGASYEPLFPYYSAYREEGAFRIFAADFVSTGNGTGIVHAAPAFGEDDYLTLRAAGMERLASPIDDAGLFTDAVPEYAGMYIKDADKVIMRDLKARGVVLEHETCVHSYPFCPRSDTPLIYRAIPSWYVRVESLKADLLKANEGIHWVPSHIKHGRFGKWLAGARDWAISRNRVWGTPLPVWRNSTTGNTICIGSIAELERYTGVSGITDIHRDVVDELSFTVPGEDGVYKRITEVLDCWFESGSMPYAQQHYPFENKAWFEQNFPAEFIAEGLDQTRGWFYTLNVLSVALFGKMAFNNVIVNGIIAASDGKKMSKRLKNYTPPDILLEQYGADALRLYMINSGLVKGQEQRFRDEGVLEVVRQTLLPYYNAFKFFSTYAAVDGWTRAAQAATSENQVDTWLYSRVQSLIDMIHQHMDGYQLYVVVPEIVRFIDELTNIYIRLNRQRFWEEGLEQDKCAAYTTLYDALHSLTLCLAPFAPFITEHIYQELRPFNPGEYPHSVHLCDYPTGGGHAIDADLEQGVQLMQDILVLGRQKRNDEKVKVKIPLQSILIIHRDPAVLETIKPLASYIQAELNVKHIDFTSEESAWIEYDIKPCSPLLGKRLGKRFGYFRQRIAGITLEQIEVLEQAGALTLEDEVFTQEEILLYRQPKAGVDVVCGPKIAISLDMTLTDALLAEGRAREVVNRIQKTRKDIGLHVEDRISIRCQAGSVLAAIIETHQAYIAKETLAVSLVLVDSLADAIRCDIDDDTLHLHIEKV
jgi:isoleucyl-tRNA synthetase